MKIKTTKKTVKVTFTFNRNRMNKWLLKTLTRTIIMVGIIGISNAVLTFSPAQQQQKTAASFQKQPPSGG